MMCCHKEFTLLLSELDTFKKDCGEEIYNNMKSKVNNENEQSLIKQGEEQTIEEFLNTFGESH